MLFGCIGIIICSAYFLFRTEMVAIKLNYLYIILLVGGCHEISRERGRRAVDSAATINSSRVGHGKEPRCLYKTIRTKIRTSQSQWFASGEDCPPPLLQPPISLHTELHPAKTDSLISVVEVYYYVKGRTNLNYQNQPHERNRRKSGRLDAPTSSSY